MKKSILIEDKNLINFQSDEFMFPIEAIHFYCVSIDFNEFLSNIYYFFILVVVITIPTILMILMIII